MSVAAIGKSGSLQKTGLNKSRKSGERLVGFLVAASQSYDCSLRLALHDC